MRLLPTSLALIISLLAAAAIANAQSARWEPAAGTLAFGQTSELQLIFEGCTPKGDPAIPAIDGLVLQRAGQSSQTFINNGSVSRTNTLNYAARPTKRTDIAIPEFAADTDKGRVTISAVNYSVGEATVGQSNVSLESVANSRITTPKEVWSGEVFPISYTLNVGRRYFYSVGSNFPDWNPAPLTTEEWTKPEIAETTINNDQRVVISYKSRALLKAPGPSTLNAAVQLINITTGASGLGFFPRQNLEQYSITSSRPTINVRPLPTNAPGTFNGAVGQFTLKANVVPATATVGEPITWTLTLAGTGNWPDLAGLPARSVSKDFRTVQPQAKRTPKEGTLFDASLVEDVVLIPTKPGSYNLGPTVWSYFDPAKGEYQTLTTAPVVVTISPAADAAPQPTATTTTPAASADYGKTRPPALPAPIPRDPLPDDGPVSTPLALDTFLTALCAPVVVFLLFWFWLAFRRAQATDPLRPRREARARLASILENLHTTKDPQKIAPLLLAWQKDAAILWQIGQAVPSAASFPATETNWATLWADTDRALYRDATPLPADWPSRADAALEAHPVRSFSALQLFRPRNLFPFAALFALGLLLSSASSLLAADGRNAYDKGDFPAAELIWRKALLETPANPSAHHNLSLALTQQNHWGEAAAHAAAAFAQQPADTAIRWNLAFTLERAGYAPSVFSGFANANPPHAFARLLSAPQWQFAAILAVTLAAFGGALLLTRAYGQRARWLKITAVTTFTLAVVLGGAAGLCLRVYSPLHDTRAAIVWRTATLRSIPTEADTTQKTTPLSAGTVAVVDRTFLPDRWARLTFPNGQTGWVRSEDLVLLWK